MELVVAIMAGGAGTRFWPASTKARPKQFLRLVGDRTLLQQSFDRARALTSLERIFVVTNATFVSLVREQLPELPAENVVGEPERKDTAAAAVLATLLAEKRFPGSVLAILTSDQLIEPTESFVACVKAAADDAVAGAALYTLGIKPTFPATGYGYLELGAPATPKPAGTPAHGTAAAEATASPPPEATGAQAAPPQRFNVMRYVEKPDVAKAGEYLASGRFLWNSGMFVWHTGTALEEMRRRLPDHVDALKAAVDAKDFEPALAKAFSLVPKISVDYGLMEKAARVRCVAASFTWSDVGSFPALAEHLPHDESENARSARVAAHDAHGNVVWSEDAGELVALVGVDDLVVVRAGKRTLVARRGRAEEIKKLVDTLPPEDQ